jgi:lysozyme family protein
MFFTKLKATGGVTSKWGITLSTARRLGLDLDGDGDVDIDDLGLVTEEVVEDVFRKIAWDAVGADDLPGGIDLIAADIAYNSFPAKFPSVRS